jgi:hypothetical protein
MKTDEITIAQQPQTTTSLPNSNDRSENSVCGRFCGRAVRYISSRKGKTIVCAGALISLSTIITVLALGRVTKPIFYVGCGGLVLMPLGIFVNLRENENR